jgi:hypothetical protein
MQQPLASEAGQDRLNLVRRQLRQQASHVRSIALRASPAELAGRLDQMRRVADSNNMPCVSDLVHQLEHLLAHRWSRNMAAQYLAAMDDAIACDNGTPEMRAAFLASVAVRGAR